MTRPVPMWMGLIAVPVITAPLLHLAIAHRRFVVLACCVVGVQVAGAVWSVWRGGAAGERWIGSLESGSGARWIGPAVAGCAAAVLVFLVRPGLGFAAGLSHALLFGTMAALFGGSLREGQTPLVTRVALAARGLPPRGALPPAQMAYTRAVTWVWTLFALAELLASGLLLGLAPLPVWSFFVTGCDIPAVLLVFAAEYAVRRLLFRDEPRLDRARLRAAFRAARPGRGG